MRCAVSTMGKVQTLAVAAEYCLAQTVGCRIIVLTVALRQDSIQADQ
jgi:hypothetical protein